MLALSFGAGSLVNSRLVMKYGMRRLSKASAAFIAAISLIASAALFFFDGLPPFWLFMVYLLSVFVSVSLLFGNLNALAMQPLGHIAGIGAAVIASVSTFVSVPLGAVVGQSFDGTLYALVGAFAVSGNLPPWPRCAGPKAARARRRVETPSRDTEWLPLAYTCEAGTRWQP